MPAFSAEAVRALEVMHQDTNGKDTYSYDKAMYGHIPAAEYMILTPEICAAMKKHWETDKAPNFTMDDLGKEMAYSKMRKSFGDTANYLTQKPYLVYGKNAAEKLDLQKIQLLNYLFMIKAGLEPLQSFIIAALRTRWLALGCLHTKSEDSVTGNYSPFDETIVIRTLGKEDLDDDALRDQVNAIIDASDVATLGESFLDDSASTNYMKYVQDAAIGAKWAIYSAESVWAITEYFFRTRGHHFKEEFQALAKKMYNSGFEGEKEFPSIIAMMTVFNKAIHPFSVHVLPKLSMHFALCGKLGNTFLLRFDAAPNGLAAITTTVAAIDCMKSEPWYRAFYKTMKVEVDILVALSKLIMNDKFGYHQSANLYGADKKSNFTVGGKTMTLQEGKKVADPVATVVEGFIQFLRAQKEAGSIEGFSLDNAKATKKAREANPSLALKVTLLCDLVSAVLAETTDPNAAASAIFPSKVEVQREALEGGAPLAITADTTT